MWDVGQVPLEGRPDTRWVRLVCRTGNSEVGLDSVQRQMGRRKNDLTILPSYKGADRGLTLPEVRYYRHTVQSDEDGSARFGCLCPRL
jgi:hypothetical protein